MSTFATHPAQANPQRPENTRLFPEEADALLQNLLQNRWQRLSSEYHDPLGMLFGNRARQWTAGWDTSKSTLYLLLWETDSWQNKPLWSFYQNGQLVFQEEDGFSKPRSAIFQQLMESKKLPFLDHAHFLEPLTDFRQAPSQRQQAGQRLAQTILARPEVWEHLKEPFLQALEADLNHPEWPLLDILKLHQVAHKVVLIDVIRQCVNAGLLRTQADQERLSQAVERLQNCFLALNNQISLLFKPALQKAHQALQNVLSDGHWLPQPHATNVHSANKV
ncbi:hypothetical protein [Vampirovibrio sp.]|uniref:hypothetical protein n=1 Tax=Vampirovibrio sp. TaxID=2717857 RepID=UPI0035948334